MNDAFANQVRQLAEMAKHEDVGRGDITSGLLAESAECGGAVGSFHLVAREAGVFSGCDVAPTRFLWDGRAAEWSSSSWTSTGLC